MRALKIIASLFLLFSSAIAVPAQDDSGFSSTVNWFYSACEDRMVIDLEGTMQSGYDLYFQAFDLFGGLGEAITGLRRISVNGDYSVSQEINWLNGESRALGTPISVVIRIGSELDPDSTLFQQPSDDYLGECEEPGSTLIAGSDVADDPRMVSSAGFSRRTAACLIRFIRFHLSRSYKSARVPASTSTSNRDGPRIPA